MSDERFMLMAIETARKSGAEDAKPRPKVGAVVVRGGAVIGTASRAIQPFATQGDGDVLYAVTTDEVDDSLLALRDVATIASEVAWDAVLSSVPDLPAAPPRTALTVSPSALREFAGTFEFASSDTLVITTESGRLGARFSGHGRIYFDRGRSYTLLPVGPDLFVVDTPARDVIRFDRESGRIADFTLNPGPWSQRAHWKSTS